MSKYISIIALLFVTAAHTLAQSVNLDSIKVSFPDNEAVVLNEDVLIQYFINKEGQLNAKSTHQLRILVFDNEAAGFDQLVIPFDNYSEANFLSGRIYKVYNNQKVLSVTENLKLKNVEVKDYYSNNIFFSDFKLKMLPINAKITANNIIDYSYEIIYKDVKFLTTVSPDHDLSTLSFKVTLEVPSFVKADASKHGYSELFTEDVTEENDKKKYTYTLNNYKRLKSHSFAPASAYYEPHLIIHTRAFTKNGVEQVLINDVKDLHEWYASLVYDLKPDKAAMKNLAGSITKGLTQPEDKIDAILTWVQNNITYIAFEDGLAGFKPDEAQRVATLKYGDCKGMANLLYELLRAEGFDAYHCWIGTRHKPYSYATPSLTVDNHMVCALKFRGKTYILDGTGAEFKWNVIPYHLEGKEALINLDRHRFEVIQLPVSKASDNTINVQMTINLDDPKNNVSGTIYFTGHYKDLLTSFRKSVPVERKNRALENFVDYVFMNAFIISEVREVIGTDGSSKIHFKGQDAGLLLKNADLQAVTLPQMRVLPVRDINTQKDAPIEFEYPQTLNIQIDVQSANLNAANQVKQKDDYIGLQQEIQVRHQGNTARINYQLSIDQPLLLGPDALKWNQLNADYFNKYYFIKL